MFQCNVGIRKALKAVSGMRAARVGISTKFLWILLQYRLFSGIMSGVGLGAGETDGVEVRAPASFVCLGGGAAWRWDSMIAGGGSLL